jgi:hypothetical protein
MKGNSKASKPPDDANGELGAGKPGGTIKRRRPPSAGNAPSSTKAGKVPKLVATPSVRESDRARTLGLVRPSVRAQVPPPLAPPHMHMTVCVSGGPER